MRKKLNVKESNKMNDVPNEMNDVPQDNIPKITESFIFDGWTKITITKQQNGKWTIKGEK